MIEVAKTNLDGALLIKPSVFEDHRGQYVETYNEELYRKNGSRQMNQNLLRKGDRGLRK